MSESTEVDAQTAARVARNDATFRAANEEIEEAATRVDFSGDRVPFICECADEDCTTIVPLSLDEYEEIRGNPRHFLNAPGHAVNAQGAGMTVFENDRYAIVEKIGLAGDIVEELDPRG